MSTVNIYQPFISMAVRLILQCFMSENVILMICALQVEQL